MNTHVLSGQPERDTHGIYRCAGLPVRLGFPSREDYKIISDEQGHAIAVEALRAFPRTSRMCRVSGQLLPYRCRQTRQMHSGIHLYDPRFFGLIQHACEPNVYLDLSELWLWALKDIHQGERLTMDYAATEEKLVHQFACHCGSPRCRGWIMGYDEPPNSVGQGFLQRWRRPCSR
ncbi:MULTISPECIES: SET domain-containing protein-lysine N-methyltransferase [Pseudomonas]|uniref:SET domain-containing protein n=1 Tax=Pseudomonas baetica TaxID=674054 RepID=A0ABX4Q381_9PSED|nr:MULTISPECIES: SET domain-containing protein-lysine N-methyltransferase [Pseudomonas]MDR9864586.1 SET domain-containing protein-lysine N-methyltransferase [Pseudomonas baetica]PKA71230.1 SET domain-containing protein [Pseudomonas baetica]PTC19739.1 SET domain-containing protein-lysine N-methyltransferase [Pseudomonas baetica]